MNYNDTTEWVEVELITKEYTLNDWKEYSPEYVYEICKDLILEAQLEGLEGCYVKFRSNMESYEECLGDPTIVPCGYRPPTKKERKELQRESRIQEIAKERSISPYNARKLLELMEAGIV